MTADKKSELVALVRRCQSGDEEAFEHIVKRTQGLARRVAFSLLDNSQVDDALQESYLLVFRKLPQLREPEAFIGWFSRIVMGASYEILRQRRVQPIRERESQRDHADAVVSHLVLRQALKRLQRKDRDILILRELLQLSYEEIGVALRLPVGTVRSRLNSARKKLEQRLKIS